MKFNYRIIIVLLLTSLIACVSPQSNKFAEHDEDQDIGLGGTGLLASSGSGLGGTGLIGEVTGFGSIFVNGIEVEYDANTPFSINGEKSSHQQLVIGDVVEILTTTNNPYTHAQTINLRHELIGSVESVNKNTNTFSVLGQTILQAKNKALPKIGSPVAIAGFRLNNQTIQATRVSHANGRASLLRMTRELPFSTKASRWLIQTPVKQNNKVSFQMSGKKQTVSVTDNTLAPMPGMSVIKILQFQKSAPGDIEFVREVNPLSMPRGSLTEKPALRSGQKRMPGNIKRNAIPGMQRFGR